MECRFLFEKLMVLSYLRLLSCNKAFNYRANNSPLCWTTNAFRRRFVFWERGGGEGSWSIEKRLLASSCFFRSIRPSVYPHVTAQLLLEGFWRKFTPGTCGKIQYMGKIKFSINRTKITSTSYEDLCTFLLYLAEFFSNWEKFQITFIEEMWTHFI